MTTQAQKSDARARAEAKYGFYKHLAVFAAVNLLLLAINLFTSPGYLWSIWPLLGWGIAIVFHALQVYAFGGGNKLLDRMTEIEMQKEE